MGVFRGSIKTKLTTKAGLIAAGVVVIGGGAAIAAPGVSLTGSPAGDEQIVEILPANDDLEAMAEHCDENPEHPFCQGGYYDGDNVEGFSAWVQSVPSEWGCIRGQLISHAAKQGPHGDHIDDLVFETAEEAADYLAEANDDPAFLERTCVTNVLGVSEDDDELVEEAPEEGPEEGPEDEDVDGFSAWVRSVPSGWGCIRGQLVSTVARGDHHEADFEALTFASAEDAAAYIAEERDDETFLDRRCVEVAIDRDGGATEDEDDEGSGNGDAQGNGQDNGNGTVQGNAPSSGNGGGGQGNGQGNGGGGQGNGGGGQGNGGGGQGNGGGGQGNGGGGQGNGGGGQGNGQGNGGGGQGNGNGGGGQGNGR